VTESLKPYPAKQCSSAHSHRQSRHCIAFVKLFISCFVYFYIIRILCTFNSENFNLGLLIIFHWHSFLLFSEYLVLIYFLILADRALGLKQMKRGGCCEAMKCPGFALRYCRHVFCWELLFTRKDLYLPPVNFTFDVVAAVTSHATATVKQILKREGYLTPVNVTMMMMVTVHWQTNAPRRPHQLRSQSTVHFLTPFVVASRSVLLEHLFWTSYHHHHYHLHC